MLDEETLVVAGGYFIARPAERPAWVSDLVPPLLLSVSPCFTKLGPDLSWAWADTERKDALWRDDAEGLGIAAERRADVMQWLNDGYADWSIRWPNVVTSLATARRFAAEFDLPCSELALLGIGLTPPHVAEFLEEEGTGSGIGEVLDLYRPLAAGGEELGYEVLGLMFNNFHSWLCGGLESKAAAELDVRPNERGFLASLADAERVARWANEDERAEPVFHQPWLVVRYGW